MAFVKKQNIQAIEQDERKHPRSRPDLIAALDDPDPLARRWAARDLAACADASGALLARLTREDDSSVIQVILTTLTCLGDPAAIGGLADCLRSDDAALRNQVIEAMKQLPDQVGPIIQGLLTDPDPDVRIFSVNILESLRHPLVETWLIAAIDADPHINVCGTALDLLCEVGSEAAVPALNRLRQRFATEPYIQFATELALKRIGKT